MRDESSFVRVGRCVSEISCRRRPRRLDSLNDVLADVERVGRDENVIERALIERSSESVCVEDGDTDSEGGSCVTDVEAERSSDSVAWPVSDALEDTLSDAVCSIVEDSDAVSESESS